MFNIGQTVKFNGKGTITDMPKGSVGVVTDVRQTGNRITIVVDFGSHGIRYMGKSQIR